MSSRGRDHTGPTSFQAHAAVIRRNRFLGPAALASLALAPVVLTEVRADPDGPEPDQEYVENLNASDTPIDLTGFQISDDASRAVVDAIIATPTRAGDRPVEDISITSITVED